MRVIKVLEKSDIMDFFKRFPSVSKSGLAKEARISIYVIDRICNDDYTVTLKMHERLLPVMKKYGWHAD